MSVAAGGLRTVAVRPGTWAIDPAHTTIGAVARHLMVTKVRGRFESFEGAIHVAEDVEDSTAELKIAAASITTGSADRDAHLRSPDFLDVERYPNLTFKSTSVKHLGGDRYEVTGDLTIRDVTRPVILDARFEGVSQSPFGFEVAAFAATGELDREEWGITWNVALETGGVLVSKKFHLEIEAQVKLQA